jgi:hypothetical protein
MIWGQPEFQEKHRRYFDFQRRSGQLPLQKEGDEIDYRGVLHRDGSVLMSVSLDQLKVMTYKIVQLLTYAHKSVTLLTTQIKLLRTQAHMSYSLHFGQSRVVVECLQGCG